MQPLSIESGQGNYTVEFTDTLNLLSCNIQQISQGVVVIDQNVARLYSDALSMLTQSVPTIPVEATEEEKTMKGVSKVWNFLQEFNCTRRNIIIAIGGGIIQDIATVAAHLYYRGLKIILVPTTLLSMADSCIGAKCAINFNRFKNQLGVFHSPVRVIICLKFLDTLSDNDIQSGYGEILKLSLTGPSNFFEKLKTDVEQTGFRNPALVDLIYESLNVKRAVIEVDEYEKDLRRILNFGHTFGHALETLTDYEIPHGQAVAWGIDLANWISYRLGMLSGKDFNQIHEFLDKYFRFRVSKRVKISDLIKGAKRDKKVIGNNINLILLEHVGSLKIVSMPFDRKLEDYIEEYMDKYNVVSIH